MSFSNTLTVSPRQDPVLYDPHAAKRDFWASGGLTKMCYDEQSEKTAVTRDASDNSLTRSFQGTETCTPDLADITLYDTHFDKCVPDLLGASLSSTQGMFQSHQQTHVNRSRSHRRERPRSHTPRPANSFIIYRREKHLELVAQQQGNKSLNNNVISKIVADMWRAETPEVKALYASKAEQEKRDHALKYPDYKYKPRKGSKQAAKGKFDKAVNPFADTGRSFLAPNAQKSAFPVSPLPNALWQETEFYSTPVLSNSGPSLASNSANWTPEMSHHDGFHTVQFVDASEMPMMHLHEIIQGSPLMMPAIYETTHEYFPQYQHVEPHFVGHPAWSSSYNVWDMDPNVIHSE